MVLDGRLRLIKILEKHTAAKNTEVAELSNQLSEKNDKAAEKTLEVKHVLATEQLVRYSNILDQFKLIAADDISTIRIMEKAYPPQKEAGYRFLIIAGAFLVALFVMVTGATIFHVMMTR